MKTTFNSLDIACCIFELQQLIGLRVNQIYDVDHKTYVFKLHQQDNKKVLIIESGSRFHITTFDWPKNVPPSGFTMKLRKHLKNKRIESICQLGNDRIVDFQFGSGEAAYHIILELFNRGNILLTDYKLLAVNVLRPHTEGDKYKFTVNEPYPILRVRESSALLDGENLKEIFKNAKPGEKIIKILLQHLDYGSALLEHVLSLAGFNKNSKFNDDINLEVLAEKLKIGDEIYNDIKCKACKGYIIQMEEPRVDQENFIRYLEFHPYFFLQHQNSQYSEFDSFNTAIDEYFSKSEGQKLELKALQMERDALKKVEKVKENQQQRIENLLNSQNINKKKAELIMSNHEKVDEIIRAVRRAIALQMSWPDIIKFCNNLSKNSILKIIHGFKFEINHITLALSDPYDDCNDGVKNKFRDQTIVDIDLSISAHANATRYYSNKKSAAVKERKTIESQDIAIKSAERKVKLTIKDLKTTTMITKARKVYWFEKFYWFISSDNYLIIGGRDQQQNELIVKKYLKKGDIYVHADLNGASSIVIKNPTGNPIPPRTLNEAGNMAVCYSIGWEAKIIYAAYWVYYDQVSKIAPTGEYLTTGSFMIRGQKNFLLPAQLALGFGFLFKLEESSVFRHTGERRPKTGAVADEIQENKSESSENLTVNKTNTEINVVNQTDSKILSIDLEELTCNTNNNDNIPKNNDHSDSAMMSEVADITKSQEVSLPTVNNDETSSDVGKNSLVHLVPSDHEEEKKIGDEKVMENCDKELFKFPDVDVNPNLGMDDLNEKTKVKFNVMIKNLERHTSNECQSFGTSNSSSEIKGQKTTSIIKRGQRSKMKKIKYKYKDQDEDERRLRMSILKSDGVKREPKKSKTNQQQRIVRPKINKTENVTKEKTSNMQMKKQEDEIDEEDDDLIAEELDIIDYLTGIPHPEDELLFAIPIVAPYSALLNYKYKVKIMPGNGKRGKSARTAMDYFLKSKETTNQEKSLIKNVNDNILSRNFPGKVKISFGLQKK